MQSFQDVLYPHHACAAALQVGVDVAQASIPATIFMSPYEIQGGAFADSDSEPFAAAPVSSLSHGGYDAADSDCLSPSRPPFQPPATTTALLAGVIDGCVLNLPDSGQDRVTYLKGGIMANGESFDIIASFDGHGKVPHTVAPADAGSNYYRAAPAAVHFVDALTAIPAHELQAMYASANPLHALIDHFQSPAGLFSYSHNTGAVAAIARIFSDRVETFCVGDASAMVFVDGTLRYINEPHTGSNAREVERLQATRGQFGFVVRRSRGLEVIDSKTILSSNSTSTAFYDINSQSTYIKSLCPTQALGHGGMTGYDVSVSVTRYTPGQHVHVVVCSDGVSNMAANNLDIARCSQALVEDVAFLAGANATAIAHWARSRWCQQWITIVPGYSPGLQTFGENAEQQDDVSAATWTSAC